MIQMGKSEGLKELLGRGWTLHFAHDSKEQFQLVLAMKVEFPAYDENNNIIGMDSVEREIEINVFKDVNEQPDVTLHAYPSYSARYLTFEDLHSLDKLVKEIENENKNREN